MCLSTPCGALRRAVGLNSPLALRLRHPVLCGLPVLQICYSSGYAHPGLDVPILPERRCAATKSHGQTGELLATQAVKMSGPAPSSVHELITCASSPRKSPRCTRLKPACLRRGRRNSGATKQSSWESPADQTASPCGWPCGTFNLLPGVCMPRIFTMAIAAWKPTATPTSSDNLPLRMAATFGWAGQKST